MRAIELCDRRDLLGLVSGVGLLASQWDAFALEPRDLFAFSVGPVVVKPSLQLTGQYDDNIFYLPNPRIDDFLFVLRPGVDFQLGSVDTQHRVTLGYDLTSRFYVDTTSQDSTDHLFSLDTSLNWSRVRVTANAGLQYLTGILGGFEATESGVYLPVGKVDRFYVPATVTAFYTLSEKTEPYLRGELRATDYDAGRVIFPYYDLFQWRAVAGATYKVTPKTKVLAEGFYGQWTTQPNTTLQPDVGEANTAGGSVGVTGQLLSRMTGTAKVGVQTVWDQTAEADATEPTGEVSVTAPITEKISASLGYRHDIGVSPQGTTVAGDPSRRVVLVYVQDSLNAGVTGRFGAAHPLTVGVSGSYILNGYATGGVRRDGEFYRVALNLAYQIKLWMNVGASYEYGSSSYGGSSSYNYDYNRVSIFSTFGF